VSYNLVRRRDIGGGGSGGSVQIVPHNKSPVASDNGSGGGEVKAGKGDESVGGLHIEGKKKNEEARSDGLKS
jgi:hypothetical protein